MKIKVETVDGFLMDLAKGNTSQARVARCEIQTKPRDRWQIANIIVPSEDPATILEGVAAYLRERGEG